MQPVYIFVLYNYLEDELKAKVVLGNFEHAPTKACELFEEIPKQWGLLNLKELKGNLAACELKLEIIEDNKPVNHF